MGIMDMRVIITLLSFLAFIGIVVWAYSKRQKSRFDEAANLPFADEEMQERSADAERRAGRHDASDQVSDTDTDTDTDTVSGSRSGNSPDNSTSAQTASKPGGSAAARPTSDKEVSNG